MLPVSNSPPSSEAQPLRKPDPFSSSQGDPVTASKPTFLKSTFLRHPVLLFFFAFISFQLLLLLTTRSVPSPRFHIRRHPPSTPLAGARPRCDLGKVFVYDLPSVFNKELIDNCHDLNPWASRCDALSNSGFGRSAADLEGVVPQNLLSSWFATDQFAGEVIFHRRLLSHRCRTLAPSAASAFYIPFYAGLDLGKHLWKSNNSSTGERDRLGWMLLQWMQTQSTWNKSSGLDHFMMLGRITWDFRRSNDGDWGGSFLYMPGMANVTRLLIERNSWDEKDVGVPYPTGYHPKTSREIEDWQRFVLGRNRSRLFSFAGAARAEIKNDFRGILLEECARAGDRCGSVDCGGGRCGNRSRETVNLFLDSDFCLQPRGDSFTRRSMFDCMISGAIPVIFWKRSAYSQYEWYLPSGDGEGVGEWSVFLDRREVRSGAVSVRGFLEGIGRDRVKRMREKVAQLIPKLVYGGAEDGIEGGNVRDAVDVAVDGVLRRFGDHRRQREKSRTGRR